MIGACQPLELSSGTSRTYHSLSLLEKRGLANISWLPVSLRVMLESVLRNLYGHRIRDEDVEALARWRPSGPGVEGMTLRRSSGSGGEVGGGGRAWVPPDQGRPGGRRRWAVGGTTPASRAKTPAAER